MRTFLRTILKPLSFLPAILMMYVIFTFSAQDADTSSQLSYKVSHKIVEIGAEVLGADFESWEIDSIATRFHGPVRKLAHMTEYFALAVSVAFPLYVYGLRGILLMLVAGLFCVASACGDEYHQSYVSGRSPSQKDVMIDSIGIFFGIVLVRIVGWTGRKTIFRPLAKKKKKMREQYNNSRSYQSNDQFPNNGTYQSNNYPGNGYPYPGYNPYANSYSRQNNGSYTNGCSHQNNAQPVNGYLYQNNGCSYQNNGQPANGYPYHPGNVPPNSHVSGNVSGSYPYTGNNFSSQQYTMQDDSENSDRLSEDMSFRKLMHDIKDQKKTVHTEKRTSKKPKIHGDEIPVDEIDLND